MICRDSASKWWRPIGYWMLTFNASLGFAVLIAMAVFDIGQLGVISGAYASILAAWCAAAGIRQWGKNNGTEMYAYTERITETRQEPVVMPPPVFTAQDVAEGDYDRG
jgi:hypothetical protein